MNILKFTLYLINIVEVILVVGGEDGHMSTKWIPVFPHEAVKGDLYELQNPCRSQKHTSADEGRKLSCFSLSTASEGNI